MIEFIVKYWLEVVFGLAVAVLTYFVKHYHSLWVEAKDNKQKELLDQVKEDLKGYFQETIAKIDSSNRALLKAVFEVQQKQFKSDCKYLLEDTNNITFEQFENLHDEYNIYKSLGGNGSGSTLFDLVQEKYSSQMMQMDQVDLLSQNFELPRPSHLKGNSK